ncbi:MAG: hypothetical protein KKC77_19115, partial [Proteobacteria bacterium]|nr:hypothetical protein [Pseudomonadota bacterium]
KFTVKEAATTLGEGTVSLTFTTDGKISGDGSFTIANAYKVPDKKEGPVTIKQGMTIKAKVTDNVLTEIGMANVGFIIENFALDDTKQKCGKIEGTISTGKIDLKNNNEVDVDGTAKVTGGWSFGTGVGTFTFGIGGSVTVSMKKSEVKKLDVKIPFSVKFTGNKEVKMSGTVDGNIDAKNQTVGGSLTLTPDDNYDFKLGTDFVEICKEGTTATATFSNNALNKLTTNVHLKYYLATKSAEGLLLEGTLTNGTYDPAKQAVSAKGKISLKRKLEKKTLTGDWKLIIKENATVEIDVVENKLDKIEGNIDFEIHEGGSALFTGSLKNANVSKNGEKFAGNVEVKLARKVFFPKRDKEADIDSSEKGFTIQLLEGGWVKGSIVDSKLGKLGAGIQFGLRKDKQQFAAGEIKGNFDFDNDKFGGDGKVTLTKEYPLFQTQKMATSGGEHDPDLALWTLAVKQGSTLGMKVEDNNLRKTKIDVGLCAYKGADKVAEGKIDGDYMVGFDHGFTGNFSAGLVKEISLGKLGTTRVFNFVLNKETSVSGNLVESRIDNAAGQFGISVLEGGALAVSIKTAKGVKYVYKQGITGNGTLKVDKDLHLLDLTPWSFTLLKGSGGTGTIMQNQIDTFAGKLDLMLQKDKKDFVKGGFEFSGTSAFSLRGENSQIAKDLTATVELMRDIQVTEKPVKGFTAHLLKKAGLTLHMKNNVVDYLKGAISLDFDHEKMAKFAKLDLDGQYSATGDPSFKGTGKITI